MENKTFKQWLLDEEMNANIDGNKQPSMMQKKAIVNAKQATADAIKKQPDIAAQLTKGGSQSKTTQAKLSADISGQIAKKSNDNAVDNTQAAFAGVNDVIGDIEKNIDNKPSMMKKRMKK